ncbi:hypothetical protein B9T62_19850 [Paenibacillus donghaensis]|uniref:GerMN domain-containing protein n=2 Tax=Paenibacillus donghaensis TaxID=414771 RepID=A0A2Z2KBE2_9BACL|nr:hypothetical protein B9T62_19850 [Paenibacillus donghaensis]
MIRPKLSTAGIAILLMAVIAGCGDKPAAAPNNGANLATPAVASGADENNSNTAPEASNDAESTPAPTQTPAPAETASPAPETSPAAAEKQSQSIDVYYTDSQIMELVPAKAEISFADDTEKYTEAFKALQTSENKDLVPLWEKIELLSLKFADGQVLIDIHKPVEAQLGAGGEAYAISALTQTYFQFPEVKSLEVLVDGEQIESLMGHVDLEHPFTKGSNQ